MSITENLFNLALSFRREVLAKQAMLDDREEQLHDLKGSPRYDRLKAQIDTERKEVVETARGRVQPEINNLLRLAHEKSNETIPMDAPSEDALKLLQLFKMRLELNPSDPKITSQELRSAIPIMGGNAAAIEMLKDIAVKCNVMLTGLPKPDGLTDNQIKETTELIGRSLSTLLYLPKLNNRKAYGLMMNGYEQDITRGRASDAFRVDQNFDSKSEFLQVMGFMDASTAEQYAEIIDRE